jgi:hypothetical protein
LDTIYGSNDLGGVKTSRSYQSDEYRLFESGLSDSATVVGVTRYTVTPVEDDLSVVTYEGNLVDLVLSVDDYMKTQSILSTKFLHFGLLTSKHLRTHTKNAMNWFCYEMLAYLRVRVCLRKRVPSLFDDLARLAKNWLSDRKIPIDLFAPYLPQTIAMAFVPSTAEVAANVYLSSALKNKVEHLANLRAGKFYNLYDSKTSLLRKLTIVKNCIFNNPLNLFCGFRNKFSSLTYKMYKYMFFERKYESISLDCN